MFHVCVCVCTRAQVSRVTLQNLVLWVTVENCLKSITPKRYISSSHVCLSFTLMSDFWGPPSLLVPWGNSKQSRIQGLGTLALQSDFTATFQIFMSLTMAPKLWFYWHKTQLLFHHTEPLPQRGGPKESTLESLTNKRQIHNSDLWIWKEKNTKYQKVIVKELNLISCKNL